MFGFDKSFENVLAMSILFSSCIFSFVKNGLGYGLGVMASLSLSILHRVNLRTISEPPKTRYLWISYSSLKFTIFSLFLILILAATILFPFLFRFNIYVLHIKDILSLFFAFVLVPKYFINQNENLKLYVSVYHWVPAPILPWQLAENNFPFSVKLTCVNYPENE